MPGYAEIAYSIQDLKVAPFVSGVAGTKVDVPGVRSMNVSPQSSDDELGGDGAIMAIARGAKSLQVDIEVGRSNPTAMAAFLGGTVTTTGSSPNQIDELSEGQAVVRYVELTGQTNGYDANGSAYRLTVLKALQVGGWDESMAYEEWSIPSASFKGVDLGGNLLKRQWYQTGIAIA